MIKGISEIIQSLKLILGLTTRSVSHINHFHTLLLYFWVRKVNMWGELISKRSKTYDTNDELN